MTNTIKIVDLKVNDRLTDSPASQYGQYINCTINSIRVTKGGRFVIKIKQQYKSVEGVLNNFQIMAYSNGALSGTTDIETIS